MPGRRADRRVSQSDFYQSFSTRLRILLLDARAGTPPSAPQFILCRGSDPTRLEQRLAEWKERVLEPLEGHLSCPMLAFYCSQHMNQFWLAALTTVTDVSVLAMLGRSEDREQQQRLPRYRDRGETEQQSHDRGEGEDHQPDERGNRQIDLCDFGRGDGMEGAWHQLAETIPAPMQSATQRVR